MILPCIVLGEEPELINETTDWLERKLELRRHEALSAVKSAADSQLAPFTTDGCSGGLSAGWEYLGSVLEDFRRTHGERPPWESCCIAHDRLYHKADPRNATPSESFAARRQADLALHQCVIQTGQQRTAQLSASYGLSAEQITALYETVANLMYRAVRIGGIPCSGLPWRWGYGWPQCD